MCDKAGDQVFEKDVSYQALVLDKSVRRSMDVKDINHKQFRKSRKKLLKYHTLGMHVGSNFLVMASLGLRKKKKHKKMKHQKLVVKSLNKEKLDEHFSSSDMGPSTSGQIPLGSVRVESRGTKSCHKKGAGHLTSMNSVGESQMENTANGEFRKRIDQKSAVLATTKQVEKIFASSVAKQCDARQLDRLLNPGLEGKFVFIHLMVPD